MQELVFAQCASYWMSVCIRKESKHMAEIKKIKDEIATGVKMNEM